MKNKMIFALPVTALVSFLALYLFIPVEYSKFLTALGVSAAVVTLVVTAKALTVSVKTLSVNLKTLKTVIDFENQWVSKSTRNSLFNEISKLKKAQVSLSVQMLTLVETMRRIDNASVDNSLEYSNLKNPRPYDEQQERLTEYLREFKVQTHTYEWLKEQTRNDSEKLNYDINAIEDLGQDLKMHFGYLFLYCQYKLGYRDEINVEQLREVNENLISEVRKAKETIEEAIKYEIENLDKFLKK
ncbi:hypothetical protein KF946_05020 [Idiomarina loihiensis]|uniref:hypothetical protein n=1 Tax=Idiomarina loihiensis TaxID=135577 RepID=UPI00129CA5D1|nr:hypothetical protein [Idiomarina loihiensis]MRJ43926.1 hypothetical protein [Idiomarina loihiensis]UTW33942.1 hypothetical protein KF946_05020 [Idiomarina loihiensis]